MMYIHSNDADRWMSILCLAKVGHRQGVWKEYLLLATFRTTALSEGPKIFRYCLKCRLASHKSS
jgi:hypothetical protein